MERFVSNSDVKIRYEVVDEVGTLSQIVYRVVDENDVEKVPDTTLPMTAFVNGFVEISIDAAFNELAAGASSGFRSVQIKLTGSTGTRLATVSYVLESLSPIQEGENSFVTLPYAEFLAAQMPNMQGWEDADRSKRIQALLRAASNLKSIQFQLRDELAFDISDNRAYTRITKTPHGFDVENFHNGGVFRLDDPEVDLAAINDLDPNFLAAVKRAQVIEANFLLGGDVIEDLRRSGVSQNTVGQSEHIFRQSKPIDLPLSKRALNELRGYISYRLRVSRS